MIAPDYAPTAEQISLRGLGFIQVKLDGNQRLHVWHPDLPRRSCFAHSPIHNHRFSFTSTVLIGTQVNRRWMVNDDHGGSHDLISHDGPRSEKGGRLSYIAGRVAIHEIEKCHYGPGETYHMPVLGYHETPNTGIVVTVLRKLHEGTVHAHSLIETGHAFDQSFDRFQLPPEDLWRLVHEALRTGGR
jgi:hypothetical protein